ncbi:MAG: FtsX-like permease family protein, partial [Thermoanaerobaculia bacterium]|nr:FtsX-like permease family protein [Thermoanaerobaculia bacterium]
VGESVAVPGGEARVVGIVADVRHNGLHEESGPEMYLSLSQYGARSVSVVVHTAGDPLALAGQLRSTVSEIDPRVPFTDFRPLGQLVDRAVSARRFVTAMLVGFAAMAVVLASLGIYGVVSYSVGRRRPEIGVRLALGAQARRVLGEELRRGGTMAAAGLTIGLVGALVASRVLGSQLYQIEATDPATYAAMTATLLAVALLAAYLPARRAARIDPVTALRDD